MHAAYYSSKMIAELLVAHGAIIDAQDNYGMTALMYASIRVRTQLVDFLLENNATAELKNVHGQTAAELATDLDAQLYWYAKMRFW